MRKSGPPRGLISYLVLELLEEKPRYGYEILKEITEISGGHWEPSYGSVYPILYKFEDEGWAERIERADEPDRKYFELTEAGHDHLAEKRVDTGGKAREFADVILGFYHVYVAFATDDRFTVDAPADGWRFDADYSAWIAEQMIRHHERDFGTFERIPDTPEEFLARMGHADSDTDIPGGPDGADGETAEPDQPENAADDETANSAESVEGAEAVADGPAN
ncbi:PadR family transcriptional regulator [Candidatus Halobonum tyrrellensis]|uniref:Transcriptional regulator n=1 Tax=Candidatus Halobonum tyrrellensis G22 TaxID=1324957 RepID=V4H9H3_9EURY|nr:PadR family transcriptional regulator [Candidatus Halobonum tyrrellensis]ESP87325.1 transcriptional regulator [Candidatus Halobonum tyrrellensis G22]